MLYFAVSSDVGLVWVYDVMRNSSALGVFICGKGASRLNADNANCVFKNCSSFGIFWTVGWYGNEVGHDARIGLAVDWQSDWFVLLPDWVLVAWTVDVFSVGMVIGEGNVGGRILRSMQPCLLKYNQSILSQINNGWLVLCSFSWNVIGNQPEHCNFDPPTAMTCLLHGIRLLLWIPSW